MNDLLDKKIMVIDDSAFSRALITSKLATQGFVNVSVPETSIDAWDIIVKTVLDDDPFDLIITDLNMPGLDGIDLISKIKDDPLSADLKIIVVSADADEAIIGGIMSLGAQAYLVKPFITSEMIAVVEAVLLGEKIPEAKGMFSA